MAKKSRNARRHEKKKRSRVDAEQVTGLKSPRQVGSGGSSSQIDTASPDYSSTTPPRKVLRPRTTNLGSTSKHYAVSDIISPEHGRVLRGIDAACTTSEHLGDLPALADVEETSSFLGVVQHSTPSSSTPTSFEHREQASPSTPTRPPTHGLQSPAVRALRNSEIVCGPRLSADSPATEIESDIDPDSPDDYVPVYPASLSPASHAAGREEEDDASSSSSDVTDTTSTAETDFISVVLIKGFHLSSDGGVGYLAERFNYIRDMIRGIMSVQFFCGSPRSNPVPVEQMGLKKIDDYRNLTKGVAVKNWTMHASHVGNLASTSPLTREQSFKGVRIEMQNCRKLGVGTLCIHLGSFRDSKSQHSLKEDIEVAIAHVSESLKKLLRAVPKIRLALENMVSDCGNSSNCEEKSNWSLKLIKRVMDAVGDPRVMACVDICHAYIRDYDLRLEKGVDELLTDMAAIGWKRIACLHVSDSSTPHGGRCEGHMHLGQGLIPLTAFRRILRHPELIGRVPAYLETPHHAPFLRPSGHREKSKLELELMVLEWDFLERFLNVPEPHWSELRGRIEYARAQPNRLSLQRRINEISRGAAPSETTMHHREHQSTVAFVNRQRKICPADWKDDGLSIQTLQDGLQIIEKQLDATRAALDDLNLPEEIISVYHKQCYEEALNAFARDPHSLVGLDAFSDGKVRAPRTDKHCKEGTAKRWGSNHSLRPGCMTTRSKSARSSLRSEEAISECSDSDSCSELPNSVAGVVSNPRKRKHGRVVTAPSVMSMSPESRPGREVLVGVVIPRSTSGSPGRRSPRSR